MAASKIELAPQPGPQTEFLSNDADICIYGGAAGSGKTFAMLLDPLRHVNRNPEGGAVYFRRTITQVVNEGGLFDEARDLYTQLGAKARTHPRHEIVFPHPKQRGKEGFKISFGHLQHEKDKYGHQGAQIPVIYFDELTHFSASQFWYLVSRNRSMCGINPYIRATTNPQADSWVRDLLDWWIDEEGYADWSKAGKKRWLVRYQEREYWFGSKEEALERFPDNEPMSVAFVPARIKDNQKLLDKDPGYLAKLKALDKVERERLLGDENKGGNWNVMPTAGSYFQRHYFKEVMAHPKLVKIVRAWDRAATEHHAGDSGDPDYTVGLKLGVCENGQYYILDIERVRLSAFKVDQLIRNTASQDGQQVVVRAFQDPGGAGKNEAETFRRHMAGYILDIEKITVNKETAARACSAQAEAGNIFVMANCRHRADFYAELEAFPLGRHDDIVDALSSAFNYLALKPTARYTKEMRETKIKSIIHRKAKDSW